MPNRTKSRRPRADRAAQFMPFAALTGYYELVRQQEHRPEPRHEPTEEEAAELSRALSQLGKGSLARITFYEGDGYLTRTDVVGAIDPALRRLRLGARSIPFDDIRRIEGGTLP